MVSDNGAWHGDEVHCMQPLPPSPLPPPLLLPLLLLLPPLLLLRC